MRWYQCATNKIKVPNGYAMGTDWHINCPINFDMVFSFSKSDLNSLPLIWFDYGHQKYEWIYINKETRDADYNKICIDVNMSVI